MDKNDEYMSNLLNAVHSTDRVTGFTHDFYNYPARFSPILAREIISRFTESGDLILDPFMGGGTTLVEAKLLNRDAVGYDISTLASFLAIVKLNPIQNSRFDFFENWMLQTIIRLNCHTNVERPKEWISKGYQRNLSNKKTWPIRKLIELFLHELEYCEASEYEKNFLRCVLLKTSQWALDSKTIIPTSKEFRDKLFDNFKKMVSGSKEFWDKNSDSLTMAINKPAYEIHENPIFKTKIPKLILTSPPYPGIHVMYHRWQIFGRKETPAPFWIANSLDGHGLTHYAMGNRHQKKLRDYFLNIQRSFESIRKVCNHETIVIQVLAFSKIDWQLPKYLETMKAAGFTEMKLDTKRIWRDVPNRKWYAEQKGRTSSSKEVILFHELAR